MMSCRDVEARLAPFLQAELSFPDRLAIHHHLAGCQECSRVVERGRDVMAVSKSACAAASDPKPEDVPLQLLNAVWAMCHGVL